MKFTRDIRRKNAWSSLSVELNFVLPTFHSNSICLLNESKITKIWIKFTQVMDTKPLGSSSGLSPGAYSWYAHLVAKNSLDWCSPYFSNGIKITKLGYHLLDLYAKTLRALLKLTLKALAQDPVAQFQCIFLGLSVLMTCCYIYTSHLSLKKNV